MSKDFTPEELGFLLQSVTYSKKKFEEYNYENEAMRKIQLEKTDLMLKKLREIIKG